MREALNIVKAIIAARKVQNFLWGGFDGSRGFEEWKRMFRKRVAKLDAVDLNAPYASVEVRKRLLQTAALSIAMITYIEKYGLPLEHSEEPSNMPEYREPINEEG